MTFAPRTELYGMPIEINLMDSTYTIRGVLNKIHDANTFEVDGLLYYTDQTDNFEVGTRRLHLYQASFVMLHPDERDTLRIKNYMVHEFRIKMMKPENRRRLFELVDEFVELRSKFIAASLVDHYRYITDKLIRFGRTY